MIPPFLRATAFEYKHRYLIHGAVYALGLAAPWHVPAWSFLQNGSSWFVLSNYLAKPSYQNFAVDWNGLLLGILFFAAAGAMLRTWGAAYLGARTVHQGGMEGERIVIGGPFRYTRNPLYLGTILNTIAICMLMRPEAAVLTFVLILFIQIRLIGREEPYLTQQCGSAYTAYMQQIPRLLPSFRSLRPKGDVHPYWRQGVLSEVYVIGCVISFAAFGWSTGFAWETTILRVLQGIVVALGLSFVARAFIPKDSA